MVRRLLVTYLSITTFVLVTVVLPLGITFARRERDRLVFEVERDAYAVAAGVDQALAAGQVPAISRPLAEYRAIGGHILVVDRQGLAVADSSQPDSSQPASSPPDSPRADFSKRPEVALALAGRRVIGQGYSGDLGADLVYVAVPAASGGTVHGAVRVTYPTSALDARVRRVWRNLGFLSLAVLSMVAAVGVALARGVARPVRELERAAAKLAAGELAVRVDPDEGPPEVRRLAVTFNATADQLSRLLESQRRFVADASHQLRTPLTALRLRLEMLEPSLPEATRPKLAAAVAETNRLAGLVQSLLTLARVDAARPGCVPVDLGEVVAERVEAWRPVADDEGVELRAGDLGTLAVWAPPGGLEQILDNLLSNSLEVAPAGTAVALLVDGAEDVELHVVDEGPGMTEEQRSHAFERFWRAGGDSGSGFGLGLAIVRQLALAAGGDVRLADGPGGRGLDVAVRLRRVRPDDPGQPGDAASSRDDRDSRDDRAPRAGEGAAPLS